MAASYTESIKWESTVWKISTQSKRLARDWKLSSLDIYEEYRRQVDEKPKADDDRFNKFKIDQ
jgi:hypothetical protein